jgi:hypothetical protein
MTTRAQHQDDRWTAFQQRTRSMRRWRLTISSVALALGLVLVATGHLLVGVVIGGLAAARLVMFARFSVGRRRSP